jgi:hypothetical protein
VTGKTAATSQAGGTRAREPGDGAAAEFERLYRANVDAVTAYFARRSADPHVVLAAASAALAEVTGDIDKRDPVLGDCYRHIYLARSMINGSAHW